MLLSWLRTVWTHLLDRFGGARGEGVWGCAQDDSIGANMLGAMDSSWSYKAAPQVLRYLHTRRNHCGDHKYLSTSARHAATRMSGAAAVVVVVLCKVLEAHALVTVLKLSKSLGREVQPRECGPGHALVPFSLPRCNNQ